MRSPAAPLIALFACAALAPAPAPVAEARSPPFAPPDAAPAPPARLATGIASTDDRLSTAPPGGGVVPPELWFGRTSRSSGTPPPGSAVFAVPRGGGFFGRGGGRGNRGRGSKSSRGDAKGGRDGSGGDDGDDGGNGGARRTYPALSRSEIEEKLNVPIYAITDQNGNGAVLAGQPSAGEDGGSGIDGGAEVAGTTATTATTTTNSVYFFLSRQMAEHALRSMQAANAHLDLKVTALHLGKVWFKLLHGDQDDVELFKVGETETVRRKVHMRLVPGMRDLVGARLLLGLNPDDVEELRDAMVSEHPDEARRIIERATEKSPNFKKPYNEIPVFMVSQMRVTKKPAAATDDGGAGIEGEPMLPLFLSSKTMLRTYLDSVRDKPEWGQLQPTLQLAELHSLVEQMQVESEMDFRSVVLFPASPDEDDATDEGGDEDDDDDNDDDGGDGSIKREEETDPVEFADIECTPFVSMELGVFEAPAGQELVPL